MTTQRRYWTGHFRTVLRIGLLLCLVGALSAFSNAFANPYDLKWEFLGVLNLFMAFELVVWGPSRSSFDRLDAWMLVFIAYAAASLAWSADAATGALAVIRWLLLALPFLYFRHVAQEPWLRLTLWSIGAANGVVMFFAISGWANWAGFANENFLTEFELISLPFLLALIWTERSLPVRLAFAVLLGLEFVDLAFFNPSRIEWLVLLGVLLFAGEVMLWRRCRPRVALSLNVAAAAVAVALLVWAWIGAEPVKSLFVESIRPRLALIVNTLRLWWDAPLLGSGAGSFDALYPRYKEWHLQYFEHADILLANKMVKAGAAHNELLQLLAEYGLVGLGLLFGFVAQGLKAGSWRRDGYGAAAAASLLVGLLIALIEFPLQNPATALLLSIAAGLLTRPEPAADAILVRHDSAWLRLAGGVVAGLAGVALVFGLVRYDQSNRLFGAVSGMLRTDPEAAFALNQTACQLNPWDRRMRMQLYTTLTFWAENSPEPVSSPEENDRIFAFSLSGAEHQPVLLLGRLQHLLNSGRFGQRTQETEALLEKLKRESSRMADVWILEAYYGLLREDSNRAAAAIRRAQSLDPTPAQRENLERLRQAL